MVEYLLRRGIVDLMAVYYFRKHAAKHYGICSIFNSVVKEMRCQQITPSRPDNSD